MSNLLKGFYVAVDNKDKRVIDSNAIISEKLVMIKDTMKETDFSGGGFSAGLNPINISEVLDENTQILGENVKEAEEVVENPVKKEVIIAEAKEEADAIISRAKEDAMAIVEKAKADAEAIANEAREVGYADGLAKGNAEADNAIRERMAVLEDEQRQIIEEYRRKEAEIEPALVDTILKIFADITKAISVDKKDMILNLVNNVLNGGEPSKNFIIRVCSEDAAFLKENKDKIAGTVRDDINIDIVIDQSMKKNQCLIDTDIGVYDCSLDIQLESLMQDIRILSASGE